MNAPSRFENSSRPLFLVVTLDNSVVFKDDMTLRI